MIPQRQIAPVASLTVPALSISGLSVAYDDAIVVGEVDARFMSGTMTAIIGPNGAGKSSLLKATLGIVPKLAGHVAFFGEPLDTIRDRVAYVPQRAGVDWDFPARVIDVVLMGLYRELGIFGRLRPSHEKRASFWPEPWRSRRIFCCWTSPSPGWMRPRKRRWSRCCTRCATKAGPSWPCITTLQRFLPISITCCCSIADA
jgi:hypothetical protein